MTPCVTLSSLSSSTVRERQEEHEKDEDEEKLGSSSKSSKSDLEEWKREQASGRTLEEGPNQVTALSLSNKARV